MERFENDVRELYRNHAKDERSYCWNVCSFRQVYCSENKNRTSKTDPSQCLNPPKSTGGAHMFCLERMAINITRRNLSRRKLIFIFNPVYTIIHRQVPQLSVQSYHRDMPTTHLWQGHKRSTKRGANRALIQIPGNKGIFTRLSRAVSCGSFQVMWQFYSDSSLGE